MLRLGNFKCFLFGFGNHKVSIGKMVGGNLMSPPELTGNTPVPDILHPVAVGILKFGRHQLYLSGLKDRFHGGFRHLLHPQEPLV